MPRASIEEVGRARRILLHGVTGSGKSTAAARLSRALGLPLHLADEGIGFLPAHEGAWVKRPQDQQLALVRALVSQDEWVLDSAYGLWRDSVLERAQVVVALDYPRVVSLGRLVRRTARRVRDQERICNGNTESWGRALGPESILLWHARTFSRKRRFVRELEACAQGPGVLRLRRPGELDRLLAGLDRCRGADG
ncbi:adenylate kinase [Actinomyces bowdenii]|uniref:Adenylate kinase n=1 Tax=Actinomyces bowdenii TaxID=131109 RepID=A0A3P1V6V0_9ACTO|nr:adenylate kinase [Actinomyces bowdenii]RRD29548.1 adenylate kinase [Actinomyces bowdenii]